VAGLELNETRKFERTLKGVPRSFVATNRMLSELLALEGAKSKPPFSRAFKRVSRAAILWPEEAVELSNQNRSLTERAAVGPYIEKLLKRWIDSPPISEVPLILVLQFFRRPD
jgi:hypothetical protein